MSLPQTGFEQRNLNGAWTTFEEEATYISELLDAVPSIRMEVVGQGTTGLDLNMFKVGTGDRYVYIIAQMHAPELAGRDALLTLIRDWATDPALEGYLEQVTILAIPTVRPDSQTERSPVPIEGVGVNTDNMHLLLHETRAIQRVVRDYQPEVSIDVHEAVNISGDYASSKALHPNIHPQLLTLADDMERSVKGAVEGGGWTWEPYWGHRIVGGSHTHNSFGLRHSVALLSEGYRSTLDNNLRGTERRHQVQVTALNAILEWHSQHFAEITSAVTASRSAAESYMSEAHLPLGRDSAWPILSPAPDGYRLSESELSTLAVASEILGFPEADGDGVISTHTPSRFLLHYLADTQSAHRLVDGQRMYDQDIHGSGRSWPPSRPQAYYKTGGVVRTAKLVSRSGA